MLLATATVAMATEETLGGGVDKGGGGTWKMVTSTDVAEIVRKRCKKTLVIDSRSFLEHNTQHIRHSVNVCCSKLVKRRLQHNKVSILDLLSVSCGSGCNTTSPPPLSNTMHIIVYDQCSVRADCLDDNCFLMVLLKKLSRAFQSVSLLKGGFLDFQATFPSLCETKSCCSTAGKDGTSGTKHTPLTSLSGPCLPSANVGPTKILPYLFLGSQQDALSEETVKKNGITYILNISTTCPQPAYISDDHFLRIPVNDNHCDKLQPFFKQAFHFLDKVNQAGGRAMVHCLAGISRSPTIAIAYVMTHLGLSHEEAYKYVKEKRPTISPNLNFMGQLITYENSLKQERANVKALSSPEESSSKKKQCLDDVGLLTPTTTPMTPHATKPSRSFKPFAFKSSASMGSLSTAAQSPTTALAQLSFASTPTGFTHPSPLSEESDSFSSMSGYPMTSLDKIVPIPCFTQASATNKRSLSMSTFELHSTGLSSGSDSFGLDKDMMTASATGIARSRSPELRARRPHVRRPNSIAFASYFGHQEMQQQMQQEEKTKKDKQQEQESQVVPAVSLDPPSLVVPTSAIPSTIPSKLSCLSSTSTDNCRTLEQQSRKSRSLEDMLAGSEPLDNSSGLRMKDPASGGLFGAAGSSGTTTTTVDSSAAGISHHHQSAPHHQSNSSISSSGSIHGSLELIQVS